MLAKAALNGHSIFVSDEDFSNPPEVSDNNDGVIVSDEKMTAVDHCVFSTLLYEENKPKFPKTENIKAATENLYTTLRYLNKTINDFQDDDKYKRLENVYKNRQIIEKKVAIYEDPSEEVQKKWLELSQSTYNLSLANISINARLHYMKIMLAEADINIECTKCKNWLPQGLLRSHIKVCYEIFNEPKECQEHKKSGCVPFHDAAKNGDVETSK